MANLAGNFNWKKSPAHIKFLSSFIRAKNVAREESVREYLINELKEHPKTAIGRFIEGKVLVSCDAEEVLDCVLTSDQLKKILSEQGQKQTGSKRELIKRALEGDRPRIMQIVGTYRVMKCSPEGLSLIEEFRRYESKAFDLAKKESFAFLLDGKPKEAYKVHLDYYREYIMPDTESWPTPIDKMRLVLTSNPQALRAVSPSDLKYLRAAACMTILWVYPATTENWLPDNLNIGMDSERAMNYLKCNADIAEILRGYKGQVKKVKVSFDEDDLDSCAECRKLNGQEIDVKDFPELPCENCTSLKGCKCKIEDPSDFEIEDFSELAITNLINEKVLRIDDTEDHFSRLAQLRKMYQSDLITEEEYNVKKKQILERL